MTFYSSDAEEDPAAWLAGIAGSYEGEPSSTTAEA
jgi:hypothetical protein